MKQNSTTRKHRTCRPSFFVFPFLFLLAFQLPAFAGVDGDIAAVLKDKLLAKATVGIHIVRLDAGKSVDIYRSNGQAPLAPASNMKLLTSSAVLDYFGPDFKFRTLLVQHGQDVILIGDGDPTIGDIEFLKKTNWTATTLFENWAKEAKKAGVDSVANVLVDDSIFDEALVHPDWDPKQFNNHYSAEVAGMTVNRGCIDFKVSAAAGGRAAGFVTMPPTHYVTVRNSCSGAGTPIVNRGIDSNAISLTGGCTGTRETNITIHDPALYAATVLSETFAANGIKITGKVARDRTIRGKLLAKTGGEDYRLVAMHETPLLQALTHANKESQNLYTETMCKRLGAATSGECGSWATGTIANANFLRKLGVDPKNLQLDDGCGLSHENAMSADAFVRILEYNYRGRNRDAYLATLPIGGEDGTLKERFKGSNLRGRVFAKTGFIEGVSALSGYLKSKDGQWYAFSILMNGLPKLSNSRAKELQEEIVKAIDNSAAAKR